MSTPVAAGRDALSDSEVHAVSWCMRTLRSVRRFKDADVDRASIEFVLHHAALAGSAKNRQPWRFVVVRDRNLLSALGDWYRRAWQVMADLVDLVPDPHSRTAEHDKQMRDGEALARIFDTVPVVVVACFLPVPRNPADFFGGASIYPAVQNLLLAARALGLGATLTTLQCTDARPGGDRRRLTDQLRAIVDIPTDVVPAAVIPLGWPAAPFTPVRRHPVGTVAYGDRWGRPWFPEPRSAADPERRSP